MTGVHFLEARGPDGMAVYAIGDVHGRLDLLAAMHEEIEADRGLRGAADWRVIHLGDYVDRGPDTRGVIDFLIAARSTDPRNICLAGNHDVGFLDFLTEPDTTGLFARHGGGQTALSYGVSFEFVNGPAFERQFAEFAGVVPESHRDFLRTLEFSVSFGDFFFCHAGIMPGVPLDLQEPRDLIWIRDRFLNEPGLHPKVIVHGHTPNGEPGVFANRVNVDTAAFASGKLTAIAIDGGEKRILQVNDG